MSTPHHMDEVITALLPAINEQLASGDTLYVKETFERLLEDPEIEKEEAREMIAFCLADELEALEKEDRPFNAGRYEMLLHLLPALPEGR